jgi:prepilin-type processing-associated H-X9-DG protein
MLVGILVPGLSHSRRLAKQTACSAGLQQIGVAICTYAMENNGSIPYGPKAPPPSATNFYPNTGNVTSLISLESGKPVGLGLLLNRNLADSKESLFCPGADEKWDTRESLALVGVKQVESSYFYRHGSVITLSGTSGPPNVKLDRLGKNRNGAAVRTLAMDTQFFAPPTMRMFNLHSRTHHKERVVNALYADGHVSTHPNTDDRFKVNLSLSVYNTLGRILSIFEELDSE